MSRHPRTRLLAVVLMRWSCLGLLVTAGMAAERTGPPLVTDRIVLEKMEMPLHRRGFACGRNAAYVLLGLHSINVPYKQLADKYYGA